MVWWHLFDTQTATGITKMPSFTGAEPGTGGRTECTNILLNQQQTLLPCKKYSAKRTDRRVRICTLPSFTYVTIRD